MEIQGAAIMFSTVMGSDRGRIGRDPDKSTGQKVRVWTKKAE
jgi:hypothetical protein